MATENDVSLHASTLSVAESQSTAPTTAPQQPEAVNLGVFVQRLSRGNRRWFFTASVPHEYLDWLGTPNEREIATVLDNLLQLARTPGRRTQGAAGGRST